MKSSYARIVRQLTRISYIAAVVFILSGMVLGAVAKPAAAAAQTVATANPDCGSNQSRLELTFNANCTTWSATVKNTGNKKPDDHVGWTVKKDGTTIDSGSINKNDLDPGETASLSGTTTGNGTYVLHVDKPSNNDGNIADKTVVVSGCVVETPTETPTEPPEHLKIDVCHVTGSASNPYVLINVNIHSVEDAQHVGGHGDHYTAPWVFGDDDAWESYTYGGVDYPGVGPDGFIANGCELPATETPDPTPEPVQLTLDHTCTQQTPVGAMPYNLVEWFVSNGNGFTVPFDWALTGAGGGSGTSGVAASTNNFNFQDSGDNVDTMTLNYSIYGDPYTLSDTLGAMDCPPVIPPVELTMGARCVQELDNAGKPIANTIVWSMTNGNDFGVDYSFDITPDADSGSGTLATGGPHDFYTSPDGEHTMAVDYTIYGTEYDLDLTTGPLCPSLPTPDPSQMDIVATCVDIYGTEISSMTADPIARKVVWSINNPNAYTVPFDYNYDLGLETGSSGAMSGTNPFKEYPADNNSHTMTIGYTGWGGAPYSDTETIAGDFCLPIVPPEPVPFQLSAACKQTKNELGAPIANNIEWTVLNLNEKPIAGIGFNWTLTGGSTGTGVGTAVYNVANIFHTSPDIAPQTMVLDYLVGPTHYTDTSFTVEVDLCPIIPTPTPETPTVTPETPTVTPETPTGTPDNTPDPTLPVPVTGVTPQIVIPVTGADRTGASTMAYGLAALQSTLFNLGLAFFGLGLVFTAVGRKMDE